MFMERVHSINITILLLILLMHVLKSMSALFKILWIALVLESVLQCTEAEAGLVAKICCLCACTQEPKTISNGGYPTELVTEKII